MKKNKMTFLAAELFLMILAIFCIRKIFEQSVPEKRVAVILPDSGDKRWDPLIKGLKDSAKANRLHLIICNTDDIETTEDEKELIQEQLGNDVDAFIVCPAPGSGTKKMLEKQCKDIPFILVTEDVYSGEQTTSSGLPVVKPDNYDLGSQLGKRMLENDGNRLQGKKIGIVAGWEESEQSTQTVLGFSDALRESDGQVIWWYERKRDQEICEAVNAKEPVDYIAVLDTGALDELGEQAGDGQYNGAKIYGMGSSKKSLALLDYGKIECLALPDSYAIGYQSAEEIAQKLDRSFYKLKSYETKGKVIGKEELEADDIERFLYSYE